MTTSAVEWVSTATQLPDDDITVLMAFDDGDVTAGWHQADQWVDITGYPCAVPPTYWSDMPKPPPCAP